MTLIICLFLLFCLYIVQKKPEWVDKNEEYFMLNSYERKERNTIVEVSHIRKYDKKKYTSWYKTNLYYILSYLQLV